MAAVPGPEKHEEPEEEPKKEPEEERGIFANIFEHTIAREKQIDFLPKKGEGKNKKIDWPDLYGESIYDPTKLGKGEKEIAWGKVAKKILWVLGGMVIGGLIGVAVVASGGALAPAAAFFAVGALGLLGGAVIPAVPFMLKVAGRFVAKTAWMAIGLAMDVVHNVVKAAVAILGAAFEPVREWGQEMVNRVKDRMGRSEKEETAAEIIEKEQPEKWKLVSGTSISFFVSKGEDGGIIYTPNMNVDEIKDAENFKAFIKAVIDHHKENKDKMGDVTMSIRMPYSSPAQRRDNEAYYQAMIESVRVDIKKQEMLKAMTAPSTPTPSAPAQPAQPTKSAVQHSGFDRSGEMIDPFEVETHPNGTRMYKPIEDWTTLDEPGKRRLMKAMIDYELKDAKSPGLNMTFSISDSRDVRRKYKGEIDRLYTEEGGPAAPTPSAPAGAPPQTAAVGLLIKNPPVAPPTVAAAPAKTSSAPDPKTVTTSHVKPGGHGGRDD